MMGARRAGRLHQSLICHLYFELDFANSTQCIHVDEVVDKAQVITTNLVDKADWSSLGHESDSSPNYHLLDESASN